MKVRYQYPAEHLTKQEWIDDVASPLKVTVKEIEKDLKQFVQGFPKERIPHVTSEE